MYQQYQQQQPQQQQSQQSFHTAQYQGSQPNHDQYLRSDAQQASYGMAATSQYRGMQQQKTFQPTGYVQSVYGQNQAQNQFQNQSGMNQFAANTNAFHTAQYRGNQPGHDQSWRADAQQPSQYGQSFSAAGQMGSQAQYGAINQSQFSQNQYGQSQAQTPASFHTANYQGNQPGHDASWRADSQHPAQSQYSAYGAQGMNQQSQGQSGSQFGQMSAQPQAYQARAMQPQYQAQTSQQFHTANYYGNQHV